MNSHRLSDVHAVELDFLKVCSHPEIVNLHDHHQLLAH
jgi:hypothetical protein